MKGLIVIVLLTALIVGCTAEQEQAYREKYEPIFKNETQKIVENISKQNEELKQQLEDISRKLSSSQSKGDGGEGGGIGENQTSPQNPPSDSGPCINTTIPDNQSVENLGGVNESNDIYGDSQLAILGNEQIDIRISPVNYEVCVREEGDVEQKQFDEIFPQNSSSGNSTFEENIPPEQQELVKNYFDKLAGR